MKPIGEQSLYEILEVSRDALPEEVEQAYARAKALYGPGSLATYSLVAPEEMALLNRRIEEARRVLLDPRSRAGYDAGLPEEPGRPRPEAAIPPAAEQAGAAPVAGEPPTPSRLAAEGMRTSTASAAGPPAEAAAPRPAPPAAAAGTVPGADAPRPGFSVPDGTPWTGEVLRRAREARGVTLHQISERTKVTRHHLENIEADRYELLPAPVYLRGILVSMAKELRLDGPKVARSYLQQVQEALAQKSPPKLPPKAH